ncbi:MAG: hypothetical protein WCG50_14725 [Rhodoferax sp.]|uniref:hypothetical protein n=1 Tax=Rhodoferax sp. TaxID=50421 RepID=UPI0030179A34
MNGHQSIIAMRHNRMKPAYVWLQDSGLIPTDNAVTLAVSDIPEAIDLRFLVGVTVLAESQNADRLRRITTACIQAKALRVIASLHRNVDKYWTETVSITDTDGVMTWQN